jgi:hypothetical protein
MQGIQSDIDPLIATTVALILQGDMPCRNPICGAAGGTAASPFCISTPSHATVKARHRAAGKLSNPSSSTR